MAITQTHTERAAEGVEQLMLAFQDADRAAKAAAEQADTLKAQLKLALESARDAQGLDPEATRVILRGVGLSAVLSPSSTMRLDTKALKASHPVAYASNCHPSVSYRLTIETEAD